METGTHKNTQIDDALDCDGELQINYGGDSIDWLTKDMAVGVIKHLAAVFDIDEILEAVEKYEETGK